MVVKATAPVRISLFGSGTDIPTYYKDWEGGILSMAINMYQTFTLYTDDDLFTISGNKIPSNCSLNFVYAFRDALGLNSMHHSRFESDSDDILESGLGSSAAAGVAMVGAMAEATGQKLSREQIAEKAWEIANTMHFSGKQDEYASVLGGLNLLEFSKAEVIGHPFDRKYAERLLPSMVLFHTNITRKSATIQEGFKELTEHQIKTLDKIKSLVPEAIPLIVSADSKNLGKLLLRSWELKKDSNRGVSNKEIDMIGRKGLHRGAYGWKLLGAGGGGCVLFIVDPAKREKFIDDMVVDGVEWLDFAPDYNGLQIKILKR